MPRSFENIATELLPALRDTLQISQRSDFCIGYCNLRGWKMIDGLPAPTKALVLACIHAAPPADHDAIPPLAAYGHCSLLEGVCIALEMPPEKSRGAAACSRPAREARLGSRRCALVGLLYFINDLGARAGQ